MARERLVSISVQLTSEFKEWILSEAKAHTKVSGVEVSASAFIRILLEEARKNREAPDVQRLKLDGTDEELRQSVAEELGRLQNRISTLERELGTERNPPIPGEET